MEHLIQVGHQFFVQSDLDTGKPILTDDRQAGHHFRSKEDAEYVIAIEEWKGAKAVPADGIEPQFYKNNASRFEY